MRKKSIPPEVIASIENKGLRVGGKNYKLKAMTKNPKDRSGAFNFPMDLPTREKVVHVPLPVQQTPVYQGPPPELVLDPIITVGPGPYGLNLYIDPNAILYQNGEAINIESRYASEPPLYSNPDDEIY